MFVGAALRRVVWSKTGQTLGVMVSVSMVSSVVMALSGLLLARWVSPEIMGVARSFTIPTGYAALALIVVSDGFRREYPYLIGRGEKQEALALAGVTKMWYVGCTALMCIVFMFLAIRGIFMRNWVSAAGWGAQLFAVTMLFYGNYLATIYRRSLEFKRLSYNSLTATAAGVLSLPLVKFMGYYGMMIRQSIVNVVGLLMNQRYVPEKIAIRWDWARLRHLAIISLPLASVGYARTSFLDSTFNYIVLRNCGEAALGIYGIATMFQGFAMQFVTAVQQVFEVKAANNYGETDSVKAGVRYLLYPTLINIFVSVLLATGLCISVGPFIELVLPRYTESIPVIRVLSLYLPLNAICLLTSIQNIALDYKAMVVSVGTRIIALVILLLIGPHTVVWCAASSVLAYFCDLLVRYCFLFQSIRAQSLGLDHQ